jgi:hypothetical protein
MSILEETVSCADSRTTTDTELGSGVALCRKVNPCLYSLSQQILTVMIIDPRVFEDVYLPRELIHRESEVGQLSRAFQPALSGSTP